MSGKYALIIANTEYTDSGLSQLTAPGKDAEEFARVLGEKEICGFDHVDVLLNKFSSTIIEAIDKFYSQKNLNDLLVLYFSGHGVRDEFGSLYLAVMNTNRSLLRSTAIKSDFIKEAMDQSRSKRQILILDCCNSGAFAQGTKAATGASIGTSTAFQGGFGRIILTASDSTQFAWEGDKVIGNTENSLFTHYLVEGLEGHADQNKDGIITVDELYDYAFEKVMLATPKQTPSKFSSKQQGEIILRSNAQPITDNQILAAPKTNQKPAVKFNLYTRLALALVVTIGVFFVVFNFINTTQPESEDSTSLNNTPSSVVEEASPTITPFPLEQMPFNAGCIDTTIWNVWNVQFPDANENCLTLEKEGFVISDNSLIVSMSTQAEGKRRGIYMPVSNGVTIRFSLVIKSLDTPIENNLANISFGIFPSSGIEDISANTLLIYQRENNSETGAPIRTKLRERGGYDVYIWENGIVNGATRDYQSPDSEDIQIEFTDNNIVVVSINGTKVIDTNLPFEDSYFWIGYLLPENGKVYAQISDLLILPIQ